MFTGIIEAVQTIKSVRKTSTGVKVTVALGKLGEGVHRGDSICVNGVCLTIDKLEGDTAHFDVMAETLRVSTVGRWKVGDAVNLERALAADGRFGGHIVQGHVDGVGRVEKIETGGGQYKMWIGAPQELMGLMMVKGSIAIDGVSLTMVEVAKDRFSVSLIPTTRGDTNLSGRRVGDKVNLEADLISKWIKKRLDEIWADKGAVKGLTRERLQDS